MSNSIDNDTVQYDDTNLYPVNIDPDGDLQGVLDALIELHQLDSDKANVENYEQDYAGIVKAITLNQEMQQKVASQIEFIDKLLSKNEVAMSEARYSANAENRFGQRIFFHRQYKDEINYFDAADLIEKTPIDTPDNEEEDVSAEEEEYLEEEDDDHVDSEKSLPKKSWSRHERQRLSAGIQSEAKRAIAYDFMKKEEEWRVWEVDKIDKAQLEIFPVSRLDWDRISSIHVLSRTKNECLMQWTTQEHPIINKTPWSKQESQQLSELVDKTGLNGQWELIASELATNRTISQCFSHYMAEKNNKEARLLKWTLEEDKKLIDAVKIFGDCNWQLIAAALKGRTGQQCLHRWAKSINPAIKRSKWTPEESDILKRAVQLYGAGNWTKVQRLIPGRTDMQCRERWVNILQPTVTRTKMSDDEVLQLVQWVERVGPRWSYIADFFPGRTDNNMLRSYTAYMNGIKRKKAKQEREEKRAELKRQKTETKAEKKRLKMELLKNKKKRKPKNDIPNKKRRIEPDEDDTPKKWGRKSKSVALSDISDVSEDDNSEVESEQESDSQGIEEDEQVIAEPSEPSYAPSRKRKRIGAADDDEDSCDEYRPVIHIVPPPVVRRSTRSRRNAMD